MFRYLLAVVAQSLAGVGVAQHFGHILVDEPRLALLIRDDADLMVFKVERGHAGTHAFLLSDKGLSGFGRDEQWHHGPRPEVFEQVELRLGWVIQCSANALETISNLPRNNLPQFL
jgi:hypothetical protein